MSNMKKYIIYTFSFTALSFLVTAAYYTYEIVQYRNERETLNPNKVSVINNTNLLLDNFKVTWNGQGREETIFENGQKTDISFKVYGKNTFSLYYDRDLISTHTQFKHNNWHGHHYTYIINMLNDKLNISLKVSGPDANSMIKDF